MRTRSARCSAPRAMTLIEVLAALALIGVLLAGMLVAQGRYARQQVLAEQKIEAVAIADRLLREWLREPDDDDEADHEPMPHAGSGEIASTRGLDWQWRTEREPPEAHLPPELKAHVLRLEIRGEVNAIGERPLLTQVHVLVPDDDEERPG